MAQQNIADPIGIDVGPSIRAQTYDADDIAASAAERGISLEATMADNYEVNDSNYYYTWGYGKSNWMVFTKMAEGNYCEVWVANDLSFPAGDPRNDGRVEITVDQALYMVQEFDEVIYPIESAYFSEAPPLNGTNAILPEVTGDPADYYNTTDDGKVMIMVFNIVDESYDDPSYPYYIVGFYTSSTPYYYDRNIIHIDCWDWTNRTGEYSARPYVYESTFAHEYQHLLHDYVDSGEESWINEGCSMYSEALCGYGYSYSHIAAFFYTPDNSLTQWGDQGDINILADYGAALIFMIYLNDHYGGSDIVSAIMQNQLNGQESVTDSLWSLGYNRMSFDRVFHDWRLANLVWSDEVGGGLYNYNSIQLWQIEQEVNVLWWDGDYTWGTDYGTTKTIEYIDEDQPWLGHIDTGISLLSAYGTDYIHLDFGYLDDEPIEQSSVYVPSYDPTLDPAPLKFTFDGDDEATVPGWEIIELMEGGYAWYSNTGDEVDYMLAMDVDLTVPAGEGSDYLHWLNITTMWDMEDLWDFGFVQVSTDNGASWTSLNDTGDLFTEEYDPSAMESIVANLPGLTSWNYTWNDISFDLSAYDGQEILVGFRYMTDWGTHYDGWLISEFSVDGVAVDLASLYPINPEVDFILTIYVPGNGAHGALVMDIPTMDIDETATKLLSTLLFYYDEMFIIVTPNEGPADYAIDVDYRGADLRVR
ncbi:MAG: hypothetical protein AB9860_07000 [Methanomassiliicoccales archaeon]